MDAVLRRRRGPRRPRGRRVRDRGAEGRLRRPQPGADHGRLGFETASGAERSRSPPRTRTSGSSGRTPIGAHQGLSHPLAQAKIEHELARLMTQKAAALYDAGRAGRRAGEHGQVRGRGSGDQVRRPGDPDPRRQRFRTRIRAHRHVLGGAPRAHGAGVPRDDLDYVAEHSLGLPRSDKPRSRFTNQGAGGPGCDRPPRTPGTRSGGRGSAHPARPAAKRETAHPSTPGREARDPARTPGREAEDVAGVVQGCGPVHP